MRIRDWSSDVCSSDMIGVGRTRDVGRLRIGSSVEQVALHLEWRLAPHGVEFGFVRAVKFADDLHALDERDVGLNEQIGRESGREIVGQYVYISGVAVSLKKKRNEK